VVSQVLDTASGRLDEAATQLTPRLGSGLASRPGQKVTPVPPPDGPVTPFARFLALALLLSAARLGADPMPVKVAVVVTFEAGADRGDKPGELQFWAERENWKDSITVPGVDHAVL
jgi:hypothetical protein